jgi:hypothetical protein
MNRNAVWWSAMTLVLGGLSLAGGLPGLRADDQPVLRRAEELRDQLQMPVKFAGFEDPKTTLVEALDNLAKRYDLSFSINERAFAKKGLNEVGKFEIASPNPIPEMNAKMGNVLNKVLSRLGDGGAVYVLRADHIEITTRDAVVEEFYPDLPKGAPLPPLVCGSFEKRPLEDALRDLARWTGGNVVLDNRIAKDARTPVTAEFNNVPLDTAVRLLADMCGVKSVQIGNVLYVTARDNARVLQQEEQDRKLDRTSQEKKDTTK